MVLDNNLDEKHAKNLICEGHTVARCETVAIFVYGDPSGYTLNCVKGVAMKNTRGTP